MRHRKYQSVVRCCGEVHEYWAQHALSLSPMVQWSSLSQVEYHSDREREWCWESGDLGWATRGCAARPLQVKDCFYTLDFVVRYNRVMDSAPRKQGWKVKPECACDDLLFDYQGN